MVARLQLKASRTSWCSRDQSNPHPTTAAVTETGTENETETGTGTEIGTESEGMIEKETGTTPGL